MKKNNKILVVSLIVIIICIISIIIFMCINSNSKSNVPSESKSPTTNEESLNKDEVQKDISETADNNNQDVVKEENKEESDTTDSGDNEKSSNDKSSVNNKSSTNKQQNTSEQSNNNQTSTNSTQNNQPSTSQQTSEKTQKEKDEELWNKFINDPSTLKLLSSNQIDFYSREKQIEERDKWVNLGYTVREPNACLPLSSETRCVYSLLIYIPMGLCNEVKENILVDWHEKNYIGVVSKAKELGYSCEGYHDR